ncbi:hypothetical protein [Dickeya poaceiphila]|uniref:Uncharacterized protein n=1 Tax=Dickeya poaceiphila TaxID=568768 RepID=A0A5B8IKX2_9GAMM|nr:hypothetical protein [Dickeya poaceiphila]QDX31860.1 hypothetical protein Dpoa569_0000012 [Dickeya poaceiphila]
MKHRFFCWVHKLSGKNQADEVLIFCYINHFFIEKWIVFFAGFVCAHRLEKLAASVFRIT